MSKRRCETCCFFQEAGLASSGWCHHPQRKTTDDVKIMVRRNELACRNMWAGDLWRAAATVGDRPGLLPRPTVAIGPEPPASREEPGDTEP